MNEIDKIKNDIDKYVDDIEKDIKEQEYTQKLKNYENKYSSDIKDLTGEDLNEDKYDSKISNIKRSHEYDLKYLKKQYSDENKFSFNIELSEEIENKITEYKIIKHKEMKHITKDLNKISINLIRQTFRFGFCFCYGIFTNDKDSDYICISHDDGFIINRSFKNKEEFYWPVKHSKTGEYFIPFIENEIEYKKPPSGSTPTDQYIDSLLEHCRYSEEPTKILKCLVPYATQLYCYSPKTYLRLLKSPANYSNIFPRYNYIEEKDECVIS